MTDGQKRWEKGAEGIRRDAPAWMNLDLLPWWLWAICGLGFGLRGAYLLLFGDGRWDVVNALGLLLLVAPSHRGWSWPDGAGADYRCWATNARCR
jgi:hypothetical protein